MPHPTEYKNVTALAKANIYFDGKVISHTILLADGSKKTLGVIYPGQYLFNTEAVEEMAITQGDCRVKLAGQNSWQTIETGQAFTVPAKSSFEIAVDKNIAQYICSFLP